MLASQSPVSAKVAKAVSVIAAARRPPKRRTTSVPSAVAPGQVSQKSASSSHMTRLSTNTRNPSKSAKTMLLSSAERCSISHTWNSSSLN